jgi:hypothetical protein
MRFVMRIRYLIAHYVGTTYAVSRDEKSTKSAHTQLPFGEVQCNSALKRLLFKQRNSLE